MHFAWSMGMVRDASGRVADPDRLWAVLGGYADAMAGPADHVSLRFSEAPTLSTQTTLASVNAVLTAADVLVLQEQGVDGVLLAGSIDPGLDEARSAAGIPVVGITEAALAFSSFVGRRVGIVTVAGAADRLSFCRMIEEIAVRYGHAGRLVRHRPVRPLPGSWQDTYTAYDAALRGDGTAFLRAFDAVAETFIEDGADTIVCGNQLFGPLLHHLGRRSRTPSGVPVVCNIAAAVKALQALVSMTALTGLSPGAIGTFGPGPVEQVRSALDSVRAATGRPA
jgi:allantoin racemase